MKTIRNYTVTFLVSMIAGALVAFGINVAHQYKIDHEDSFEEVIFQGYINNFIDSDLNMSRDEPRNGHEAANLFLLDVYEKHRLQFFPEIGIYIILTQNKFNEKISPEYLDKFFKIDTLSIHNPDYLDMLLKSDTLSVLKQYIRQ